MVKKIALEEHFLCPGLVDYWWPTMVDVARPKADELYACLTDFGDRRLETMDKAGIARAVLGDFRPRRAGRARYRDRGQQGARLERFPRRAKFRSARTAIPAWRISPCRTRRRPPTSWSAACASSEFCGAMINGHTHGQYLDDPVAASVLGAGGGPRRA